jgi:hypothetical protein
VLSVIELEGDPRRWTNQLARIAGELASPPCSWLSAARTRLDSFRRVGEDVAPRVREFVG